MTAQPTVVPIAPLTCTLCGKASADPSTLKPNKAGDGWKLPKRGWTATNDGPMCNVCRDANFIPRSIRAQIQTVDSKDERTMQEVRRALADASIDSAAAGNMHLKRLFAADPAAEKRLPTRREQGREPPATKLDSGKPRPLTDAEREGWLNAVDLPKMPAVNGYYPAETPRLSPGSLSGLTQIVERHYGAARYDCFVSRSRMTASYRFGSLPIEVRRADLTIACNSDSVYTFTAPVSPGKRIPFRVWLDRRNLARLRLLLAGEGSIRGAKIVRCKKRMPEGSSAPPKKAWFFRLSVLLPKPKVTRLRSAAGQLYLRRHPQSLLIGLLEGSDEKFEFPGDKLRETIVGFDRTDRRRQQEQSLARRILSRRARLRAYDYDRTARCEKHNARVAAALHLVAASLARWCVSHEISAVDYDQTDKDFLPHCPWRKLTDCIRFALENAGIALHLIGDEELADDARENDFAALVEPTGQADAGPSGGAARPQARRGNPSEGKG